MQMVKNTNGNNNSSVETKSKKEYENLLQYWINAKFDSRGILALEKVTNEKGQVFKNVKLAVFNSKSFTTKSGSVGVSIVIDGRESLIKLRDGITEILDSL